MWLYSRTARVGNAEGPSRIRRWRCSTVRLRPCDNERELPFSAASNARKGPMRLLEVLGKLAYFICLLRELNFSNRLPCIGFLAP